jgi:hypothetical protein
MILSCLRMTRFNDTTYLIIGKASSKYLIRTILEYIKVILIKVLHFAQKFAFILSTPMS